MLSLLPAGQRELSSSAKVSRRALFPDASSRRRQVCASTKERLNKGRNRWRDRGKRAEEEVRKREEREKSSRNGRKPGLYMEPNAFCFLYFVGAAGSKNNMLQWALIFRAKHIVVSDNQVPKIALKVTLITVRPHVPQASLPMCTCRTNGDASSHCGS